MIAVILSLTISKYNKDLSVLLTIAVCVMVCIAGLRFMQPVVDFLNSLEAMAQLEDEVLSVLLRAVGIGLVSDVAVMVCGDAGCAGIGKALQILSSAVILWLSIPIFTALLELIRQIMGEL